MATEAYSLSALRFALRHLYEPRALQSSPLVKALALAGRANAPSVLRQTLTKAIESLKPSDDVRAQSPTWRVYEVLFYRYVQQCSLEEVADQLGLSIRHLKREQRRALEALAERLSDQFGMPVDLGEERDRESEAEMEEEVSLPGDSLQWVGELTIGKAVEFTAVLPAVLDLVQSIASRYGVHVQAGPLETLPALAVDAVVLRQALLSLLCVAIRRAPGGTLAISARPLRWHIEVLIAGLNSQPPTEPAAEDTANLEMARQLLSRCGGSLQLADGGPFRAAVTLPAAERLPVLVVDDHTDALQLLQRYVTDTRYRVFGARNAEEAISLAAEVSPQVIVLDVMMPDVDGWELLGRLKEHPLTRGIPIVACTILAQEELAFSLGVSAFLRKPVSRRELLAALDRLAPQGEARSA